MKAHRIYNYADLPVPRLELRWETVNPPDEGFYNWVCIYELVIRLPRGDIRRAEESDSDLLRVELGRTRSQRTPSPSKCVNESGVETPFREGVHAMHDSAQLRLPAFACHGDYATLIDPLWSASYNWPPEKE